jgi:hypothetical protein
MAVYCCAAGEGRADIGALTAPLCIDLYCGLGGWAEGFLSEGYRVIGFDIERRPYPGELVLQDVRTIHGSQFRDAAVIVGSSPCQEFSYRAMPWKRAKALGPPVLGMELFEAQFRIQREACEAAGRYIPLVVENVCGAQRWVGRARWHYGSFYLWGDVPALMPYTFKVQGGDGVKVGVGGADYREDRRPRLTNPAEQWPGRSFQSAAVGLLDARKGNGGGWFGTYADMKAAGRGALTRYVSSKSSARKEASALIAKIPFDLAAHIARTLRPVVGQ